MSWWQRCAGWSRGRRSGASGKGILTPMDRMDRMGMMAWMKGMNGDFGAIGSGLWVLLRHSGLSGSLAECVDSGVRRNDGSDAGMTVRMPERRFGCRNGVKLDRPIKSAAALFQGGGGGVWQTTRRRVGWATRPLPTPHQIGPADVLGAVVRPRVDNGITALLPIPQTTGLKYVGGCDCAVFTRSIMR